MTELECVKAKTMDFSKRVRAFRFANNLSQAELAKLLGVTANYVHLLEKGEKEPSETLEKFFDSLASSPVYEPIPDPEKRGLVIGVGSATPIVEPGGSDTKEAKKAKAAVDYILANADSAGVSIFLGIVEATKQAVSSSKKKR